MAFPRVLRTRGTRHVLIYGGLVLLPALVTVIIMLTAGRGDDGRSGSIVAAAHPFNRLLLAVAGIVVVCRAVGVLARRLGQPTVVGEIAAGILLGPSIFGSLWPEGRQWLIPDATVGQLQVLAQLSVVFFVFMSGLELDVKRLRGRGSLAVVISHVSITAPFLLGVLLAVLTYQRFAPAGVGFVPFALFLGVASSVTALPVLARILLDLGMYHGKIGTLVMTCALVDDLTAWILLALVIAVATASSLVGVLITIVLTGMFTVLLWALRPLLTRLMNQGSWTAVQLVVMGALLAATCTEWIGVHAIFGAFLFGLVLPGDTVVAERARTMVSGLTTMLLPLFFAVSGFGIDLRLLLSEQGLWLWCIIILLVSMVGKFGGSALAARAMGTSPSAAWQIGALMNCRGLTALVVLDVGRNMGVLSSELFTNLVLMTLVSTALAMPVVKWAQRHTLPDALDPPVLATRASS